MANRIEELVRAWGDPEINEINRRLSDLEKRLYYTYEPSLPPNPDFHARLGKWLDNLGVADDESQKTLFRLAAEIFYVGPSEFLELYRCAYHGPIARWLIDQENIDLLDPSASDKLQQAVMETWFCPISDSMKINSFYHVNNIPGKVDYRPDWRSLAQFGDTSKIQNYCNGKFKRLVLLEDFVGGGSQMRKAVDYASKFGPYLETLVVPLIICPKGMKAAAELENNHASTIRFEPIVTVPEAAFLTETPSSGEPQLHTELRVFAIDTYSRVSDGQQIGPKPYHPLGFPPKDPTGGLIVMYTNTPDNTLPLIHWPSRTWQPLFPRHSRV